MATTTARSSTSCERAGSPSPTMPGATTSRPRCRSVQFDEHGLPAVRSPADRPSRVPGAGLFPLARPPGGPGHPDRAGYDYVHIGNYWEPTATNIDADQSLRFSEQSTFWQAVYQTSALSLLSTADDRRATSRRSTSRRWPASTPSTPLTSSRPRPLTPGRRMSSPTFWSPIRRTCSTPTARSHRPRRWKVAATRFRTSSS